MHKRWHLPIQKVGTHVSYTSFIEAVLRCLYALGTLSILSQSSPNRVLMPDVPTGLAAAVTLENLNKVIGLSRVPDEQNT